MSLAGKTRTKYEKLVWRDSLKKIRLPRYPQKYVEQSFQVPGKSHALVVCVPLMRKPTRTFLFAPDLRYSMCSCFRKCYFLNGTKFYLGETFHRSSKKYHHPVT